MPMGYSTKTLKFLTSILHLMDEEKYDNVIKLPIFYKVEKTFDKIIKLKWRYSLKLVPIMTKNESQHIDRFYKTCHKIASMLAYDNQFNDKNKIILMAKERIDDKDCVIIDEDPNHAIIKGLFEFHEESFDIQLLEKGQEYFYIIKYKIARVKVINSLIVVIDNEEIMMDDHEYVEERVKIGITKDVRNRIKTHQKHIKTIQSITVLIMTENNTKSLEFKLKNILENVVDGGKEEFYLTNNNKLILDIIVLENSLYDFLIEIDD